MLNSQKTSNSQHLSASVDRLLLNRNVVMELTGLSYPGVLSRLNLEIGKGTNRTFLLEVSAAQQASLFSCQYKAKAQNDNKRFLPSYTDLFNYVY